MWNTLTDYVQSSTVREEYRVKPLFFLCWVTGVVIPRLPPVVAQTGASAPGPEVTALKASGVVYLGKYETEVSVAGRSGSARCYLELVAWIAELLQYYWLA